MTKVNYFHLPDFIRKSMAGTAFVRCRIITNELSVNILFSLMAIITFYRLMTTVQWKRTGLMIKYNICEQIICMALFTIIFVMNHKLVPVHIIMTYITRIIIPRKPCGCNSLIWLEWFMAFIAWHSHMRSI